MDETGASPVHLGILSGSPDTVGVFVAAGLLHLMGYKIRRSQGGITCGAIEDPRKSSKAIDERVIINFRDKNVVIARFRDKNVYR